MDSCNPSHSGGDQIGDASHGLEEESENLERIQKVFDFHWDVLVPVVSGNKSRSSGKRWRCLMSTACPNGDPDQQRYVTASDEAFTVLMWENYRDFWIAKKEKEEKEQKDKDPKDKRGTKRKASKKNKEDEEEEEEEEEEDEVSRLYSQPKGGVKHFGGWSRKGRNRYKVLKQKVIDSKGAMVRSKDKTKTPNRLMQKVEAIEREALDRIQRKHGVDPNRRTAAPAPDRNQNNEEYSDDEPEWLDRR